MSTTFLLPGSALPASSSSKLKLGPGTAAGQPSAAGQFVATKMGLLRTSRGKDGSERMWVEGRSKRYIPATSESVLGTIIARHAEGYRVDIGSAQTAALNALSFEGATKRSKPNLKVGTLVYARVSLANRDMEPELECVDASTGRADGFGELKGGLMVQCSLQTCRALLSSKHPLLPTLAAKFPFETAIGVNGRIWVKADTVGRTIALGRMIEAVDSGALAVDESKGGIERHLKAIGGVD